MHEMRARCIVHKAALILLRLDATKQLLLMIYNPHSFAYCVKYELFDY